MAGTRREWHGNRASLQRTKVRCDRLDPVLESEDDAISAADALGAERIGNLVCHDVEVTVRLAPRGLSRLDDGHGVRVLFGVPAEEVMNDHCVIWCQAVNRSAERRDRRAWSRLPPVWNLDVAR